MSLVGRVGRKRPRARLAMLTVYVALALGALTTLYPFVLMVATGLKGPTDQNDNRLVPAYLANMDSNDAAGKLDEGSLLSKFLADKYAGDASQIRSTRIGRDATAAQVEAYGTFLMRLPLDSWMAGFRTAPNQVTGRLAIRYQAWLRGRYGTVEGLNEAYTEQNGAFQQVVAPQEQLERRDWSPVRDRKFLEWLEFKATLPAEFRIPVRAQRMFQEFWRTQTHNQFDQVPPEVAGAAKAFEELALPRLRARWDEFVSQRLPARFAASTVESQWRSAIGAGTPLPIEATERAWVASNASLIRTEFASRNYAYVGDYVALHGRVLLNTLIFCLLAIATQLTVNPLAAYALSRFPLSSTYKLLVFLLATMAFPGEVAMIPSFLLLKDLGLLNTFAALVLPTAASGYMIYL
ncbi:MAG: carbohydrate ABC transporter permease, partial [Fimbriimonas ginsengisoli]|nr:carbohydrate ABC transporter permease [Fimbriimonas ginsengisoli]